jgi:Flavodoxin
MNATIVYESIYGNTRQVAEAIAEGLRARAGTEASSLSRKLAVKAADDEGLEVESGAAEEPGLRAWLKDQTGAGTSAAAF